MNTDESRGNIVKRQGGFDELFGETETREPHTDAAVYSGWRGSRGTNETLTRLFTRSFVPQV